MSVAWERRGAALVVTLVSPPVNAIGQSLRVELRDAVRAAARDRFDRIVVTGVGNFFAAGPDVRELDLPPLALRNAAVVGGGNMGAAIAYALDAAGIAATIVQSDGLGARAFLDRPRGYAVEDPIVWNRAPTATGGRGEGALRRCLTNKLAELGKADVTLFL